MKIVNEIVISIVLGVLAILFLDPFMFWMPDQLVYLLVGALLVFFVLFAGFIWKEKVADEREQMHKMIAGRFGYLIGSGLLVLGLIVQTLVAHPDPWLVAALVGMVVGKLVSLFYARAQL
jgi:hypothetical protein